MSDIQSSWGCRVLKSQPASPCRYFGRQNLSRQEGDGQLERQQKRRERSGVLVASDGAHSLIYSATPLGEQTITAIARNPTQSHNCDTNPTSSWPYRKNAERLARKRQVNIGLNSLVWIGIGLNWPWQWIDMTLNWQWQVIGLNWPWFELWVQTPQSTKREDGHSTHSAILFGSLNTGAFNILWRISCCIEGGYSINLLE